MIASVSRTKEWILASCEKNVKAGNHQGRPKPREQNHPFCPRNRSHGANTRQKKTFIKKEVLDRN